MTRPGLPAHILWLLKDHASEVGERNPCSDPDLAEGVAFLYTAEEPYFLRNVLAARDHDPDPAAREAGWRLAHDHARLRAGWMPSDADLVDAPTLKVTQAYVSTSLRGPAPASHAMLIGRVLNADGVPASKLRVTSFLIAVEAETGLWARTFNRFYRLCHDEAETVDPEALWREGGR
jgi:hypothetical protein